MQNAKNKLFKNVIAGKVIVKSQKKPCNKFADTSHPLHSEFELLPSGRNIYNKPFIPYPIQAFAKKLV